MTAKRTYSSSIYPRLKDQDGDFEGVIGLTVTDNNGEHVCVAADSHGDHGTTAGYGEIAIIELYQGKLRLLVWADINREDPTHVIDLSGALESNRNKESD